MSIDQLLHLLADGGAISGFAVLAIVVVLLSQQINSLVTTIDKRMDETNRRMDQLANAVTDLTLALIAGAPPETRPEYTKVLRSTLENKRSEK